MSDLVKWAKEELERAGCFDHDADYGGMAARDALAPVELFASQGHSGGSAWVVRSLFNDLVRWRPLSPLTSDPAEWMPVDEAMLWPGQASTWQSRRRPDAFSRDGGRTYYLLDERKPWWRRWLRLGPVIHTAAAARPKAVAA